jgi:hypothetical protein
MYRVKNVTAGPAYTIDVEFDDGTRGTVSLEARLFGPMFEPLRDEQIFARVSIDEYGAVCWPNGADLAPDALDLQVRNAQSRLVPA